MNWPASTIVGVPTFVKHDILQKGDYNTESTQFVDSNAGGDRWRIKRLANLYVGRLKGQGHYESQSFIVSPDHSCSLHRAY